MSQKSSVLDKNYFYHPKSFNVDYNTNIYQYLAFEYFIRILQTETYFIRSKRCFEDKNERTLPIKLLFAPVIAGSKYNSDHPSSYNKRKQIHNDFEQLNYLYTSCWTTQNIENILMWKSYASKMGVCIKSTIGNYIASFKQPSFSEYNVFCSKITYENLGFKDNAEEYLFCKNKEFADEREIRFIFEPKQISDEQTRQKDHINLDIFPSVMIDDVILSPYIGKATSKWIIDTLKSKYDFKIKQSTIELQ